VLFLWCDVLWCFVVFFGVIVPASADGVVLSDGAGVAPVGGADGAGLVTVPVWAKAGAAIKAAARRAALISGSFIGTPIDITGVEQAWRGRRKATRCSIFETPSSMAMKERRRQLFFP
jgi:hypothetical protein